MTISYKELGLVNTRGMFAKAVKGGYAIPAYNFNNLEQLQAIIQACCEVKSPVILQVSKGARQYANSTLLKNLARGAVEYSKELTGGKGIPITLHLDHGDSFEMCKACVDDGFTSVMIDASKFPFEKNIELTKKVVEYAHGKGVVVEAELGKLAGIEDAVNVSEKDAIYTNPEEVAEFVQKTNVDSLAIAIGTSHGAYKFKGEAKLDFDRLHRIEKMIPGFPIVLHGSSSVPQEYVQKCNQYGGNLPGAKGVPEDMLREAARSAVCKINIDTDLRLVLTATIREVFAKTPGEFDPRKYLGPARSAVKELVRHKIKDVLGSAGKA